MHHVEPPSGGGSLARRSNPGAQRESVSLPPDVMAELEKIRREDDVIKAGQLQLRPYYAAQGGPWHRIKSRDPALTPEEYAEALRRTKHTLGYMNACQQMHAAGDAKVEAAWKYMLLNPVELRNTDDPYITAEVLRIYDSRHSLRLSPRESSLDMIFGPSEDHSDFKRFTAHGSAVCADATEYMRDHMASDIIDFALPDPPYGAPWVFGRRGKTDNDWDRRLDWEPLWEQLLRVLKENGTAAIFNMDPEGSELVSSHRTEWRWTWYWQRKPANPLNTAYMPLTVIERVDVFTRAGVDRTYNATGLPLDFPIDRLRQVRTSKFYGRTPKLFAEGAPRTVIHEKCPVNLIPPNEIEWGEFDRLTLRSRKRFQDCQKPVELLRYLIRTHTNPGDLVLDFCAGSMTTAIACMLEGRTFLCIEKDKENFRRGCARIERFINQRSMLTKDAAE